MRCGGSVARVATVLAALALSVLLPRGAQARAGLDAQEQAVLDSIDQVYQRAQLGPVPVDRSGPLAVPDRFGPGAVLSVGNVRMKVVNYGVLGNPFGNTSSDPSAQWPGSSGVEYLFAIALVVSGKAPTADPQRIHRASYFTEWRPPSLDPVDRIYRAFDGIINGARFVNDDGDFDETDPLRPPKIDEDFLDGRDNDGDGLIDEDHAALGQQEYSYVISDNTIEAINSPANEKHIPLGLEARVKAWAYSIQGFQDFNVCEYEFRNISDNVIDSMYIGWMCDIDAGPIALGSYWTDDIDYPQYPSGEFLYKVGGSPGDLPDPLRKQGGDPANGILHDPRVTDVPPESALCPRVKLRINAFSIGDQDGDNTRTPGIGTFQLITHTTDPLGISAPKRVGFRAFRSFQGGTAYSAGGRPRLDHEWYEFMSGLPRSESNIDDESGLINKQQGDGRGDYATTSSIGPFLSFRPGQVVSATIAFGVRRGTNALANQYPTDYANYHLNGVTNPTLGPDLVAKYSSLQNCLTAQIAYEGIHEPREGFPETNPEDEGGRDLHGRETPIKLPRGSPPQSITEDCSSVGREARDVIVNDREYSWFDFDCDYCTGVYDAQTHRGLFHKTWNAAAPPPNPNTNLAANYNFSDNPDRRIVPSADRSVHLAWDNISEITPDPKSRWMDFRGFQVWKVSDWARPVGSAGPAESDWKLYGEFRVFDYFTLNTQAGVPIEHNYTRDAAGVKHCPKVFIPNAPKAGHPGQYGDSVEVCLDRFDLWNHQSGEIIKPDWTTPCDADTPGVNDPVVINTGEIAFNGGSAITTFSNVGVFRYLCLEHPTRLSAGTEVASAGTIMVTDNASDPDSVVVHIASTPGEFSPAVATVRKNGHVRWVNDSDGNHAVQSDRNCKSVRGVIVHRVDREDARNLERRIRYPIGRYQYSDREVKNGFVYFYSVTAFDSTTDNSVTTELAGRRSAVEAEGVVPEVAASTNGAKGVWVVPNPYRGYSRIQDRPSTWDLTPNATDPTGTHIDFLGLPRGKWTIRIYTVSGDLVQELHSEDAVNESIRQPVKVGNNTLPGFNRQQDNPNDGQARWNLISRNGQDIVSGIYLFTVDSNDGTQRGKFVVIR
jgi:plastocyanin